MNTVEEAFSGRVLMICQDNIGDLVFSSALIATLPEQASVDALVREDTAAVARFMPRMGRVHTAPLLAAINPVTQWGRFRTFRRTIASLKAERYDAAILVGKNWRLGLLAARAGIPVRVGYGHFKLARFLTHVAPLPSRQLPVVPALMTLRQAVGGAAESVHYVLDPEKVATARARREAAIAQADRQARPWVGLHAFAGRPTRCVPLEVWRSFAQWLTETGKQVVWFGVPKELDRLRALSDVPGWYCDALGDGSLDDTIGLLALCQAYVGHDSGVLHMASASGLRTLGVFAPGEPARTFAQGPGGGQTLYRPSPADIDAAMLREAFEACFPALAAPVAPA